MSQDPQPPRSPSRATDGPRASWGRVLLGHPRVLRGPAPAPRRRRRWGVAVAAALVLLLLPVMALAGTAIKVSSDAVSNVRRIPAALPSTAAAGGARPVRATAGPAAEALTMLLIGVDTRSQEPNGIDPVAQETSNGWGRTDTIMLVHLSADRRKAYVVSIPRDTWLTIPGHGENKINAAHTLGGPQLLVQTVEKLTNIHIDHLVAVDFAGFVGLSDAVGGVPVLTESGTKWLYGVEALNFVRERKNLLRGDFDRVERQQAFMRALMAKVLSTGTFTNPARFADVLGAVSGAVSVDEGLDNAKLRDLALSLRHLRSEDVIFLTVPVTGTAREAGLSVVRLDDELGASLWQAVREDKVGRWVLAHGEDPLGSTVEDPMKRRRKAKPTPSASATGSPTSRPSARPTADPGSSPASAKSGRASTTAEPSR